MREVLQYTIVSAHIDPKTFGGKVLIESAAKTLVELVSTHMNEGWQPFGTPLLNDKFVIQALVKYKA